MALDDPIPVTALKAPMPPLTTPSNMPDMLLINDVPRSVRNDAPPSNLPPPLAVNVSTSFAGTTISFL